MSDNVFVLPGRVADATSRQVGDEFVVVDARTQRAHALSGPAADVWRASETGRWTGPVSIDLHATIEELIDAGLLEPPAALSRRSMLKRTGAVVGGVGIASIALPMASAAASPTRSITLTPSTGFVGSTVSVSGTGFPANNLITITFDSVTVTTTPAAPSTTGTGTFTNVQFTVPAAVAGNHTVAVVAGGQSATATFTVVSQLTSNPSSLPNQDGSSGQSVTLTGTGFAANSTITLTRGGDFTSATFPATVTTNATGGFTATVTGIHYPTGHGTGTFTATDGTNTASVNIGH